MAADIAGNDLSAVGVPITGFAAVCWEVAEANVIADTEMGKATVTLAAEKWHYLGLFKDDGGAETGSDSEDATEFFQQGYKLAGLSTRTIKLGLAEDNPVVQRLLDGKEPNANGVVYVEASDPSEPFLLFSATQFKNGFVERRHGVARISEIEVDQEERGSVRAKSVTFEWVPSPLFQNLPYKKWFGKPSAPTPVP